MNMPSLGAGVAIPPPVALEQLGRLAEQWQRTGSRPVGSDDLDRQQFQALCVAVGRPQLLLDPVLDFNSLHEALRNWATGFIESGDRQRRFEQHKQMCAWANAGAGAVRQSVFDQLAEIADSWALSGEQPEAAGPLSSDEFVAVCLAANQASALDDPIHSFLHLDGWLQEWVLGRRGMPRYVGHVVGHPERY
jgi:hypothetical protein